LGWINLHASLLPKYRGAAPIQWAIASGETVTGNTTMRIDAGMDTGEMLLQEELRIGMEEMAPELSEIELAYGDYSPGRFGWMLEDLYCLGMPIPITGHLGLWRLPAKLSLRLVTEWERSKAA